MTDRITPPSKAQPEDNNRKPRRPAEYVDPLLLRPCDACGKRVQARYSDLRMSPTGFWWDAPLLCQGCYDRARAELDASDGQEAVR